MIVTVQRIVLELLDVAILEENVVDALGVVIALLTTLVGSVGEKGMVGPALVAVGLEHAGRVAVAERVAEVAPHRPHQLLELRRAHRGLEFLERWHAETTLPGKLRIRRQHRAVVGHEPVLRDERRRVEPGPRERPLFRRRGKHAMSLGVALQRSGERLHVSLRPSGPSVGDRFQEQGRHQHARRECRRRDHHPVEPLPGRRSPPGPVIAERPFCRPCNRRHESRVGSGLGCHEGERPLCQAGRSRKGQPVMCQRLKGPPDQLEIPPQVGALHGVGESRFDAA